MGNNGAKLKFVSGEYAGAEIDLAPFADVTLGRNPEIANFVFNSEASVEDIVLYSTTQMTGVFE